MSPFSAQHIQIKGKSQMLVGVGGFLVQCEGCIYLYMYLFYLTAFSFIILSMLCDEISKHLQKKERK